MGYGLLPLAIIQLVVVLSCASLWSSVAAVSLSERVALQERQRQPLYVDILNFARGAFFRTDNHWDLQHTQDAVDEFIKAADRSGYNVKIFIDNARPSDDSNQKWVERREQEVRKGSRKVPQGLTIMIGDVFRARNIPVHYSVECDNDSTLATFAQLDGAAVLSGDKDFLRYHDSTFKVYWRYEIRRGRLVMTPSNLREQKDRFMHSTYPVTTPMVMFDAKSFSYRRGVPHSHVRRFGNPHITARGLRQAAYARLPVECVRLEVFPIWNDLLDEVEWTRDLVSPDPAFDALLDSPIIATETIFPIALERRPDSMKPIEWSNFVMSLYAIVARILQISNPDTDSPKSFFSIMRGIVNELNLQGRFDEESYEYAFDCKRCGKMCCMSSDNVKLHDKKRLPMPSACKRCI